MRPIAVTRVGVLGLGRPKGRPAHVLIVSSTAAGVNWLLDRWAELRARLEPGEAWAATDQFKASRLLGKTPLDAIDDPDVILIFLASSILPPDGNSGNAFRSVIPELMANRHEDELYYGELEKRQLDNLTPPDAATAREVLKRLVDRRTSRLLLILARHQEIAEADAAEAPMRLAFDPSAEGDKLRRYALSAARMVNQTLATFVEVRNCIATDETDETDPIDPGDTEASSSLIQGATDSGQWIPEPAGPATQVGRGSTELAEVGDRSDRSDAVAHAAPTEPNPGSSLVIGPLSLVDEDAPAGQAARACGGLDRGAPTEPNRDLAVAGGRPSLVKDNTRAASATGLGGGAQKGAPTEPNAAVGAACGYGQQTTAKVQSPGPNAAPGASDRVGGQRELEIKRPRDERIRNWHQRKAAERAGSY